MDMSEPTTDGRDITRVRYRANYSRVLIIQNIFPWTFLYNAQYNISRSKSQKFWYTRRTQIRMPSKSQNCIIRIVA